MTTSNYIDITGLHLQALADIVLELEDGFKLIYGTDVNVSPNSPDGQMINLFAQAKMDVLDLISSVYGSFSPTSAQGSALDQRCALNGVTRRGATKTNVDVVVTTVGIVVLNGLSSGTGIPFTVSDTAGNLFYLTTSISTANGANTLNFTAAVAGAIEITTSCITKIETVTLNVTSVNNTGGATIQGVDEETDAALRFRRSVSVANPAAGYLEGLIGALLALDDVTDAQVYENNTDTTDSEGIPPHSIWVVVAGGTAADIAAAIYLRRNAGAGMYGSTTTNILQPNGFEIPIKHSVAATVNLYIDINISSVTSAHVIDDDYIKALIYDNFTYGINEIADFTAITTFIKNDDPLAVINSGGVSASADSYQAYLAPATIDKRWVVATARIAVTVV
jgi:uncharacterized phage protein gp47/JayE